MAKNILIVDDEPALVKGLRFNLEQQEGYNIDVAYDGEEAVANFDPKKHDVVLLDLMLPKLDGMEVCQRIRSKSDVPIIMLTAKGDDMDKIMGLEIGADDYLTKPFNMLELKARIKAVLRRTQNGRDEPIAVGNMEVSLRNRTVFIGDREVDLTAKEFDLLALFITHRGEVYDRNTLLDRIWKHQGDLRTVDVHIRRLREKIEADPGKPTLICTKWGVGYYFTTKAPGEPDDFKEILTNPTAKPSSKRKAKAASEGARTDAAQEPKNAEESPKAARKLTKTARTRG